MLSFPFYILRNHFRNYPPHQGIAILDRFGDNSSLCYYTPICNGNTLHDDNIRCYPNMIAYNYRHVRKSFFTFMKYCMSIRSINLNIPTNKAIITKHYIS